MWYVYIVRCLKDDSLYCGITNNLEKRLKAHNGEISGGAKYTKGRRPVIILKSFQVNNKSYALRVEKKIKSLSREKKIIFSLQDIDKNDK